MVKRKTNANQETVAAADEAVPEPAGTPDPSYLVELAKSGRADCNKCSKRIAHQEIRVGVILEGNWGLLTRWQHLDCTIFHNCVKSVDQIDGYKVLSAENKKLVSNRFLKTVNEIDEEFVQINPDELVRQTWNESMEPHEDLLMPLLPYQKEGLAWMIHQENSTVRGGILADEMGMGKTIQAISVMLTNRPDPKSKEAQQIWNASDEAHEWKGNSAHRAGTLIVLPTVAIRQWQMEIARFTREGSLKVKVYHGSARSISVEDILQYDVIITSYKVSFDHFKRFSMFYVSYVLLNHLLDSGDRIS
jgi:DNA repair protein RAD16